MSDRTSLFDEGPAGEWRGWGVRDRTSLFDEGPANVWRGQGVRNRTFLFDEGPARVWRGCVASCRVFKSVFHVRIMQVSDKKQDPHKFYEPRVEERKGGCKYIYYICMYVCM